MAVLQVPFHWTAVLITTFYSCIRITRPLDVGLHPAQDWCAGGFMGVHGPEDVIPVRLGDQERCWRTIPLELLLNGTSTRSGFCFFKAWKHF